eukprot:scaffold952_cov409-Prasinococcus_capsulatus_cf.AAC.70
MHPYRQWAGRSNTSPSSYRTSSPVRMASIRLILGREPGRRTTSLLRITVEEHPRQPTRTAATNLTSGRVTSLPSIESTTRTLLVLPTASSELSPVGAVASDIAHTLRVGGTLLIFPLHLLAANLRVPRDPVEAGAQVCHDC